MCTTQQLPKSYSASTVVRQLGMYVPPPELDTGVTSSAAGSVLCAWLLICLCIAVVLLRSMTALEQLHSYGAQQ